MKTHRKVITALAHNLTDVLEHGPRLSYDRRTAVGATCCATQRMLLTGLGAMGVGTMWVDFKKRKAGNAPDFADEQSAEGWFYKTYFKFS